MPDELDGHIPLNLQLVSEPRRSEVFVRGNGEEHGIHRPK